MSAPGPSSNTAHIGSRASLLKRDRTISRLAALHYRVFNKNEFRHRPQEARESLDAIASELGPFDSLPPKAQRLREDLLAFTEGLEAGDNANNRGASVALAATERPPQYPTAAEIVEEVVRRLNQDVPWASEAPTTPDHDVRDIPTFYNHMVEERHDGLWPRENYTPEVQDDYRAPWHADRNHGLGINANESPFAEIFNQDIELPKKSSGTCVFWKNMGRPFERESPHDKSFIGSRSALVERWRVEAESGKVRSCEPPTARSDLLWYGSHWTLSSREPPTAHGIGTTAARLLTLCALTVQGVRTSSRSWIGIGR